MPTTIGSSTFPTGSAATSLMSKMPGFESLGLGDFDGHAEGAFGVVVGFEEVHGGASRKEIVWRSVAGMRGDGID